MTIGGRAGQDTLFAAGTFPVPVQIDGTRVDPMNDGRFLSASDPLLFSSLITDHDAPLAMHIHVLLVIEIDGEFFIPPANVGIRSDGLLPIHTHDADGILHLESSRPRTFRLRDFFAIWGVAFNGLEILDNFADASHRITMTVNGQPSTALGALILNDLDVIVIHFNTV